MIVYFIRGLPGSGKTSLASDLELFMDNGRYEDERVCWVEADEWMKNSEGFYEFDFRKLAFAHASCLAEYERALRKKVPRVIVSNTSVLNADVDRYQKIAEEAGYTFVSLVVENRAGTKSIHNVPEETMAKMLKKFELKL